MLEKDYIEELIEQFSTVVIDSLHLALIENNIDNLQAAEEAVGELVSLPASQALSLAPESLATLMQLTGVGDSVGGYAAYTLSRIGDIYKINGKEGLADLRYSQASCLAITFGYALNECPCEFKDLEKEFLDAKGK